MFGNAAGDSPDTGKPPQRMLYSVPEVANLLGGVTERYVWHIVRTGVLPSKRLGRRRFVTHDDLTAFVKSLANAEETARGAA